jgi:hypothetical protein
LGRRLIRTIGDYWVTRFNQDAGVLGRTVVVNGQPLTIVGVAPRGFDGTTRGTRGRDFRLTDVSGTVIHDIIA